MSAHVLVPVEPTVRINTSDPGQPAIGRFLDTNEVAQVFRTSADTVRYWRHIGYGPRGTRIGRRVLYREADVAGFIATAMDDQGQSK